MKGDTGKMTTINSVLGPIDSGDLGFTLMHEHIVSTYSGLYQNYPQLIGDNPLESGVAAFEKAKAGGVSTILDASVVDLCRDVDLMVEVSRRSGVNIIATSGWWLHQSPFFLNFTADQWADAFAREIEVGIADTGVKTAILKSASDSPGVTEQGETILRAIARAHTRTGAPIMIHSYPAGEVARQQLAVLKEEGVPMNRIKVDHSNDTTDVDYLVWILEQGCYIGFDRYPGYPVTAQERTKTLKALIDLGWADKICPSHDHIPTMSFAIDPERSEWEAAIHNPHGFLFMQEVVFAQLREMGVSEEIIGGLCVNGPRNFWEGV